MDLRKSRPHARPDSFASHHSDVSGSSTEVDYLEVSAEAYYALLAHEATFTLTVESEKLVADGSALQEVEELKQLDAQLTKAGASPLSVTTFEGQTKSGVFGSSLVARYTVSASCKREALSEVVLAIGKNKDATLHQSRWSFPDDTDKRNTATARATRSAKLEAETIVKELDESLKKPHRVLVDANAVDDGAPPVRHTRKVASSSDGMYITLASRRVVTIKVTLRYRV